MFMIKTFLLYLNTQTCFLARILFAINCLFFSVFTNAQSINNQLIGSVATFKAPNNSSITFSVGELIVNKRTDSDESFLSSGFLNVLDATTSAYLVNNLENFTAKVYPNPVFDFITITTKNRYSDLLYFELSDIQGKIVSRKKYAGFNKVFSVDISTYSKGTYLLKIRNDQNVDLASYKIIKN